MRIMQDAVGSQNLIPGHKSYILRVQRIYDLCSGVTPIFSFTDHLHVLSFAYQYVSFQVRLQKSGRFYFSARSKICTSQIL